MIKTINNLHFCPWDSCLKKYVPHISEILDPVSSPSLRVRRVLIPYKYEDFFMEDQAKNIFKGVTISFEGTDHHSGTDDKHVNVFTYF